MDFYLMLFRRLLLAFILGGIIGYERESTHRPAGFRTHILVCVGSTLVMLTSEFVFKKYGGMAGLDPTRLGAQVISGIGFLGAGTIIREGINVKGLTTAASLWAVSCVGLAIGIGFYEGAIAVTVLIFLTLILLRRFEGIFSKKIRKDTFFFESENRKGQVAEISAVFDKHGIIIKKIEFENDGDEGTIYIKVQVTMPCEIETGKLMGDLHYLNGIKRVYKE